jgi:hypothetical protein
MLTVTNEFDEESRIAMRNIRQTGSALLITLVVLVLLAALLAGFITLVMTDQRLGGLHSDQTKAFYAAEAAMEKMTADLGTLFSSNPAPVAADIDVIASNPPSLNGVSYTAPDGSSGYQLTYPRNANGNPSAQVHTILSGPFQGMIGLITPYNLSVTSHLADGGEVKLQRTMQTVAIPAFQFGMFSQSDLSFFAGPDFNFGGRVQVNGNLFLAEGDGATLTLRDRVTAAGEVIRTNLSNGWPTTSNYNGTVNVTTAPGTNAVRALAFNEGSLLGTLPSSPAQWNEPTWSNLSLGTYGGNIRNGRTGAGPLNLSIVLLGQGTTTPIDLIRRPMRTDEGADPANILAERYFASNPGTPEITSLRILLSDNGNDINLLPTINTAKSPVYLGTVNTANTLPPGCRLPAAPLTPPPALSTGSAPDGYWTVPGSDLIGGCIKIEMQNAAGAWLDVTDEILAWGTAGRNLALACAEPYPNAILRFQRVRDTLAQCASVTATDYWPNVLYDPREGDFRDNVPTGQTTVYLGGVMHYVELDMNNLTLWLTGTGAYGGGSGANAVRTATGGMVLYFSDRRGNLTDPVANRKLGEYGFNDVVNPASASGAPNGNLDTGEDLDGDGVLRVYGGVPSAAALANLTGVAPPAGGIIPSAATTPATLVTGNEGRVNRPLFFRRALELVNGSSINVAPCVGVNCGGLTIASENPVYIKGNFNASGGNFNGPHVAASVIADAVTLLSNSWNDANSFATPHNASVGAGSLRGATTSWYRVAVIAGKGLAFPQPAGTAADFGTDGGVHNFLRYIEDWSGQTLNYTGSLVNFYNNRQAVGVYKCCTNVYNPPTRVYNFDTEFLQPNLLPPRTPMFRDVNTTGFTQLIMPNQ